MSYFDQGYNQYLIRGYEIDQLPSGELKVQKLTPAQVNNIIPDGSVDLKKGSFSTLVDNENIQTSNFVTGSTGWQIKGNGDAEFNNVTIRGTIYATAGDIGGWVIEAGYIYL